MVLEVEEFNSEVKNDLGGRLTSEVIIRYDWFLQVFSGWGSSERSEPCLCAEQKRPRRGAASQIWPAKPAFLRVIEIERFFLNARTRSGDI